MALKTRWVPLFLPVMGNPTAGAQDAGKTAEPRPKEVGQASPFGPIGSGSLIFSGSNSRDRGGSVFGCPQHRFEGVKGPAASCTAGVSSDATFLLTKDASASASIILDAGSVSVLVSTYQGKPFWNSGLLSHSQKFPGLVHARRAFVEGGAIPSSSN